MPGSDSDAPIIDSKRGQQDHVGDQHQIRDQAEDLVVDRHEDEHAGHADDEGGDAHPDVVLAEARADHLLFDQEDRRRQRAGAQQNGKVARLARAQARDLEPLG